MPTLDGLSGDTWPTIVSCLTGVSLFDLACVNRWTWQLFSQDVYWRDRLVLGDASNSVSADQRNGIAQWNWRRWLRFKSFENGSQKLHTIRPLQQYTRAFSIQFPGLSTNDNDSSLDDPRYASYIEMLLKFGDFVQ